MNILGTGLSGLVGSRIVTLLSGEHTFENLSLETGVDITDRKMVESRIAGSDASWVFHFAAYTDVQGAEKERNLGEAGLAWKVNVLATGYIVDACRKSGKKLIYLDSDYAFDGTQKIYSELDSPHPLGWYAMTKTEGAKQVAAYDGGLILRISNPYRAFPVGKKDFVHKMLDLLRAGQPVTAASDQVFSPTFVDDLAKAIQALMSADARGIYHVAGIEPLSPFESAKIIASVYGIQSPVIQEKAFADIFRDRAPVPQYAALSCEKLRKLGVYTASFLEGVTEVKRQEEHPQVI